MHLVRSYYTKDKEKSNNSSTKSQVAKFLKVKGLKKKKKRLKKIYKWLKCIYYKFNMVSHYRNVNQIHS